MCGIAGIVAYRDVAAAPVDVNELRRMREFMAARGPDGAGEWLSPDGRVGLAHRRLAIIDLDDRAAQPMVSADGSLVIIFNGEIYNYRELKRQLKAKGVVFRTQSDTEVLLSLYHERGSAMVQDLRGMFAFAIWDTRKRALFLARDPFGIKPLYLADDGRTLRFASQVKALAAGGAISKEPSSAGMAGFFLWGHVPEPWTWLASVKALPAGSTLAIQQGESPSQPRHYFDLREEIVRAESAPPMSGNAVEEAVDAVANSVRSHLVSDVPVGAFLSAGRDSTLIAALAASELRQPLQTLTLGFDEYRDTSNDEVPAAEAIARTIGASHRTLRIARGDFEAQREHIFASMDQPSIDGVNTYFVSRAATDGNLKVALSGLGGDELFGGYPSFRQVPWLSRRLAALSLIPQFGRSFRLASSSLLRHISRPKWAGLFEYGGSAAGAYLLRRSLFMPWELEQLMDAGVAREGLRELRLLDELNARVSGIRNPAAAVMSLEMSSYMRNQLLRDADWAGMAHSLEVRVPFVDPVLLRRWLPWAIHSLPFDRQQLLAAASPSAADVVRRRRKSGFNIPVKQWVRPPSAGKQGEPGLRPWARALASQFVPVGPSLVCRTTGPKQPVAQRILIYRFGQLGDTVVALPALKAVRRQFLHAHIALLTADSATRPWVSIEEVLPAGLVDDVISYEADGRGVFVSGFIGLMRKLRAQRYDLVVYLVPRTRTRYAVMRDLLYFRFAGIRKFAGHTGFAPLPRRSGDGLPRVQHEAEHLLTRLQHSGIGERDAVVASLNLSLTDDEQASGRDWLCAEGITNGKRSLVGIGPGSKWPSKRWPEERFAELGRRLVREMGVLPIVFGGSDEENLADRLIRDWGMGANAAGKLSVRAAAAVLLKCDLYVGNDTGTMHLAAAVGTRCIGIFSAQDWPGRWYPYGPSHVVLRTSLPCEGCKLVECVEHDIACLRAISVDEVFAACHQAMISSTRHKATRAEVGL